MKLCELIDRIDSLNDDRCIFAAKPWSSDSDSYVCPLGDQGEPPLELLSRGYVYFLEVHVAKEVLEVISGHEATPEQKRNLLLFYAENDAYPPWVYGQ